MSPHGSPIVHRRRLRAAVWALVCAGSAVAVGTWVGAAQGYEHWVVQRLQRERAAAGAPALRRMDVIDAAALERARRLAVLPDGQRLAFGEPVEQELRAAGLHWLARVTQHLDMVRDDPNPTLAFQRQWQAYERAWRTALDPAWDAVGAAAVTASDGWIILVVLLVETLPPVEEPRPLERATVDAANAVRGEHGLEPLVERAGLSAVARAHSEEMARRGYFDHASPEGALPADRLRAAGVVFRKISENIAMIRGQRDPVATAVASWMASPSHREALLDPDYVETGVGVAVDEEANIFFTQLFVLPPREGAAP